MNTTNKPGATRSSSTRPPTTLRAKTPDTEDGNARPASNATQPLEKASVRRTAQADQAVLQKKGPNALPVSDYPLKEGLAANTLDKNIREQS